MDSLTHRCRRMSLSQTANIADSWLKRKTLYSHPARTCHLSKHSGGNDMWMIQVPGHPKDNQTFQDHLNSVNYNIQFTVELPSLSPQSQTISFPDTSNRVYQSGRLLLVYTVKLLTPISTQISPSTAPPIVSIQSCDTEKDIEQHLLSDLKVNGYPKNFIELCCIPKPSTTVQTQDADTTLQYIKGISKQV